MVEQLAIRLMTQDDADALGELYQRNQHLFSTDEPGRDPMFFTPKGQRNAVPEVLREHEAGRMWPGLVLADGELIGRISLFNIRRGHMHVAEVGGWLSSDFHLQGLATATVRHLLDMAFDTLELHKLQGYAKRDNVASLKVMDNTGFERVGVLRRHVHDRGQWHDQILYEKLAPWCDGTRFTPEDTSHGPDQT